MALFHRIVSQFALVGEVGLDRRKGNLDRQKAAFREILEAVHGHAALVSVHSAGCVDDVLDLLEAYPHSGYILHWFTGNQDQLTRAVDLGCYFSANLSMKEPLLRSIPEDRLLPETDYPVSRANKGALPGDTRGLEQAIANVHESNRERVRTAWYRNLRTVALSSGAIDRMPGSIADLLLLA